MLCLREPEPLQGHFSAQDRTVLEFQLNSSCGYWNRGGGLNPTLMVLCEAGCCLVSGGETGGGAWCALCCAPLPLPQAQLSMPQRWWWLLLLLPTDSQLSLFSLHRQASGPVLCKPLVKLRWEPDLLVKDLNP